MSCCRFILLKPLEHTEFIAALLLQPIQIMPLVLQNMRLNTKCPGQPASWYFHAHVFATGALFATESPHPPHTVPHPLPILWIPPQHQPWRSCPRGKQAARSHCKHPPSPPALGRDVHACCARAEHPIGHPRVWGAGSSAS